jgi:hypothetical protein
MGAELWDYVAPWAEDPAEALLALQMQFLAEHYDLLELVNQQQVKTRDQLQWAKENPQYALVVFYQDLLEYIEQVAARGIPEDKHQRIELARKLGSQGIGNVLDVTSVAKQRGVCVVQLLDEEAIRRLVGTSRPTSEQAEAAVYKISEQLGRGEAVCFPIYSAQTDQPPVGWYFVGYTVD